MLNEKQRREAIEFLVSLRPERFKIYAGMTEPGGDGLKAAAESLAALVRELEAWPDATLEGAHLQAKNDLARRRAEMQESGLSFNSPDAKAVNLEYWTAMDFWPFDEAITLVCGRDPQYAKWHQIKACLYVSPFAKAYEKVRLLAQRSEHMNYGQATVWRNSVCLWVLQSLSAFPDEVRGSAGNLASAILRRVAPIPLGNAAAEAPAAHGPQTASAGGTTASVGGGEDNREHAHARQDRRLARLEQLGGAMRKAGDSWHCNGGRPGALADLVREEEEQARTMADRSDVRRDLIKAIERRFASGVGPGVIPGES